MFCGKPIILWSIEAAKACGCFDEILVSTDSHEIAAIARQHGVEVPFIRPPELSDDHAGTAQVIVHAINELRNRGAAPEKVCCIYATAPFITVGDLRTGLDMLEDQSIDYAFPVTTFDFPIQRALRITDENTVRAFYAENIEKRSQDLEPAYHDAGQFYWGRADAWLEGRAVYGGRSVPILLDRHRVQDIDTPEDWRCAELMFEALSADEGI